MRPAPSAPGLLQAFLRDRRGGTAVEYGLILGLIVLAIFVSLDGFADEVLAVWDIVDRAVQASTPAY